MEALVTFATICALCGPISGQGFTVSCNSAAPESVGCHALNATEIEMGLRSAALGSGDPGEFRIEVLDHSRGLVPRGRLQFNFAGLPQASADGVSVLHGMLEAETGARQPVWARVRMTVRRMVPVAKQDLPNGAKVTDDQWQLRDSWLAFPESSTAVNYVGTSSSGARLKRAVREGAVIQASWLDYPLDIRRGQVVDLHVRSGATHLRLQAIALTNAHRGESVELRLSDRGLGLSAVTLGPGQAMVDTTNLVGGGQPSK